MRRDPETREGERAEPQFLRPRPSFGERASERDGRRAPPLRHEEQRGAAGERGGEIISSDGRADKRPLWRAVEQTFPTKSCGGERERV